MSAVSRAATPPSGGSSVYGGKLTGYIRVFPRRTKWTPVDDMAFVGDPPLFRPDAEAVHVSVTFTWDIPEALRLQKAWEQYYPNVEVGGPAFGDPGGDFTPGRYIKEGVVFTSRGCPRACGWCFVPVREKAVRELPITDGWIVQDNNLFACSRSHIEAVFRMLSRQRKAAIFSGGIDTILLQPWHVDLFKSIRVREIWVACDTESRMRWLKRAAELLSEIPVRKRRCYVMVGYNEESLTTAEKRLEEVYSLGFLPFAQLYRGIEPVQWSKDWKALARKWSRPAAYRRGRNTRQAL